MKIYLTKTNYGLTPVGGRLPGQDTMFGADDYNAIAIVYANGKLYVGDDKSNEAGDFQHPMIMARNRVPRGSNCCNGRIWYDRNVVSFYVNRSGYRFPSSDDFFLITVKLKNQLAEKIQHEQGEYTPERLQTEREKLEAINNIEAFTLVITFDNIGERFKDGREKCAVVMMTVDEYIRGGFTGYEKWSDYKTRCNNIIDLVDGQYQTDNSMPGKLKTMPGDDIYSKRMAYQAYNGYPYAVEEGVKRKKLVLTEEQAKRLMMEISSYEIDVRANEADTNPTDAQKKAGNYKMGHISVKGMAIAIENPKGSYRKYKDEEGNTRYNVMQNHYGYFNITKGKDGDAVDVFIGPHIDDFTNVYCVDQNNKEGEFDETKVMLGFHSKEEAKQAYLSNYSPTWKGFREITEVSLGVFKRWLYRGRRQRQPFAEYVYIQKKALKEARGVVGNQQQNELFYHYVDLAKFYITMFEERSEDYNTNFITYQFDDYKYRPDFYVKATKRALEELQEDGMNLQYYHFTTKPYERRKPAE